MDFQCDRCGQKYHVADEKLQGARGIVKDIVGSYNDAKRARNAKLSAEVRDLQEGLEMVEEKARAELGMVRPNEILVQITRR